MRRMLLVLTVAVVMAAMMAVSVSSAFARGAYHEKCSYGGHGQIVATPTNDARGHCTYR